jgi:deoxyribose-phosphate aldolase
MKSIAEIIELANQYDLELPPALESGLMPVGNEINALVDHTLLKADATPDQVKQLCQEAVTHRFASVCVNPVYVPLVAGLLSSSPVKTCGVMGFPLGASPATLKVLEALSLMAVGATEIDMVLHIGALKSRAYGQVLNEIQAVTQAAHAQGVIVKVIIETCLLTRHEKIMACLLSQAAGADYVKTSTGFSTGGATVEDVDLMYRVVGPEVKVKASGGIRDLPTALAMVKAGASRLGTSSGVQIAKDVAV